MYFLLKIELPAFDTITGFAALDQRRLFKLRDHREFEQPNKFTVVQCEVTEAFARAWFGNDTNDSAEVDVDWLVAGELVDDDTWSGRVNLNPQLSPGRIQELYIRARFARLEEKLAKKS
jgi:hypothetical protein